MNFSELVTSSVFTRALALIILFIVMLVAAGIAAYEILAGQALNPDVISVLTLGLGYALTILGLNFGVRLSEPPHTSTPVAQTGETDVKQP